MGRPIKRKFFGVDNVNDGLSYSDAGGEGVQLYTDTPGTNYSQGLSATVGASPIGGVTATISSVQVYTANGAIYGATVGVSGTGYTTAPSVTLVKPANVAVLSAAGSYYPDGSNVRLSSTTGIYIGMAANTGYSPTNVVTNIYSDGNVRLSGPANININTAFSFGDIGSGGAITATLFNVATTANTIQANAWTLTTSTIGKQADIVSQRSARRYKVTNADGTSVCRLVANAAVASAHGPTSAGEMTITATDSTGGTYYVKHLCGRTATLYPLTGSQFNEDVKVAWTSTGVAVLNSGTASVPSTDAKVKIATNN